MLLVEAVTKALEIERATRQEMPYLDLGEAITEFSRIQVRGTDPEAAIKARHKLDLFYLLIAVLLSGLLLIATRATVPAAPGM
ncbi:MAG: hypothetical protein HY702_01390 [Gemmatimonadetes bacterium]|nr:hypothetical protein [Gemmatimonadota bacterium]